MHKIFWLFIVSILFGVACTQNEVVVEDFSKIVKEEKTEEVKKSDILKELPSWFIKDIKKTDIYAISKYEFSNSSMVEARKNAIITGIISFAKSQGISLSKNNINKINHNYYSYNDLENNLVRIRLDKTFLDTKGEIIYILLILEL